MALTQLISALVASCLVTNALADTVVISDTVANENGNFNFEVLGSLCIAKGTTANVQVNTNLLNGYSPSQKILVLTQSTLHNLYSDGTTCSTQDVRRYLYYFVVALKAIEHIIYGFFDCLCNNRKLRSVLDSMEKLAQTLWMSAPLLHSTTTLT